MSTGRHSTTWRRCRYCGTSTGRLGARGSPDTAIGSAGASEDRAAWCHLDGCHAPAEQDDQSVAVTSAKQAGVLGQGRDDMLGDLVRIGGFGLVVPDVQVIAADEPDPQHYFSHGHAS